MATASLHDRLVAALQRRGETIVGDARSTRYTVLTRKGGDGFYYVGRAGALRAGRTVAGSIPVSGRLRAMLLGEACAGP